MVGLVRENIHVCKFTRQRIQLAPWFATTMYCIDTGIPLLKMAGIYVGHIKRQSLYHSWLYLVKSVFHFLILCSFGIPFNVHNHKFLNLPVLWFPMYCISMTFVLIGSKGHFINLNTQTIKPRSQLHFFLLITMVLGKILVTYWTI